MPARSSYIGQLMSGGSSLVHIPRGFVGNEMNAGSLTATYDGTNKVYGLGPSGAEWPLMTSGTAPAPQVVIGQGGADGVTEWNGISYRAIGVGNSGGYDSYNAVGGALPNVLADGTLNPAKALVLDYGSAVVIHSYSMTGAAGGRYATDFKLQGSNTGTGGPWTDIDVRTAQSDWVTPYTNTCQSPGSYRYYKWTFTKAGGTTASYIHTTIRMFFANLPMVCQTGPGNVPTAPSGYYAVCRASSAAVPNSTLNVSLSRDNATFTAVPLKTLKVLGDGTSIFGAEGVNLSGQPAGTTITGRVSMTDAAIKLYGFECGANP